MLTRTWLAIAAAASVTAALLHPAGPPAGADEARPSPAAGQRLATTGWALPSLAPRALRRDAEALTQLDVVGVSVSRDGRRVSPVPDGSRRLLRVARAEGLHVELLFNNYSNRDQEFDPRAAHRLLSHPARVRKVARSLAGLVARQGWDGVNVDLERVRRGDADGLVLLVRRLQATMPAGRTVSIDVSARTTLAGYRAGGYRLGALGAHADVVVLMTYDYSGPTWSRPGPIGPLRWQRDAVGAALERVPARRLDLGIAGYGYTWPRADSGRVGRSVTVRQARRIVRRAGAEVRWHPRAGEWSARLPDGTRLWWSDRRSYDLRRALARELGLHGTAVWRLGSADPLG